MNRGDRITLGKRSRTHTQSPSTPHILTITSRMQVVQDAHGIDMNVMAHMY